MKNATAGSHQERTRRWQLADAVTWAGIGAVAGAIMAALIAPRFAGGSDGLAWWWWLALVTATALLWAAVSLGRDYLPGPISRDDVFSVWAGVATVILLLVAVFAFPREAFVLFGDGGWDPSISAVVQWTGASCLAVVGVLLLVAGHAPTSRSWKPRTLTAAAGALTVALVGGAVGYASLYQPSEHTVADEGALPEFPLEVSRVGWEWTPPEGSSLESVEAGTRGPLMRLGDGVVALAGTTGEELWTFRRPHDPALQTWVVGEGEQVHVWWRPTPGDRDSDLLTILDSATGQVLSEGPVPAHIITKRERGDGDREGDWWHTPEFDVYAGIWGEEETPSIRAWASGTEEELWSLTPSEESEELGTDCYHRLFDDFGISVVDGLVLVPLTCGDHGLSWAGQGGYEADSERVAHLSVTARDARTGDEVWRWEEPVAEPSAVVFAPRVRTGRGQLTDGESAVVVIADSAEPRAALDAGTGEVAGEVPEALLNERGTRDIFFKMALQEDTGGSVFMKRVEDDADTDPSVQYDLYSVDPEGEVLSTIRVGDHERNIWYDYQNSVALGSTTVLMPHTGREEEEVPGPVEFSVLSVPLGGEPEDAVWIEIAEYEEFERSDMTTHVLLPVPGAVLSYGSGSALNTVYGLVP